MALLGVTALGVVVVVAGFRPGGEVRPAYACTGGASGMEYYAGLAAYVAVVDVVEVGGPENGTPPLPTVTPASNFPTPPVSPTPIDFDLTGIGATLRVVDDLMGTAPAQFEVDALARERTELQIRQTESNSILVSPCPIGFLVPKYEAGQRQLVIAGLWEGQSEISTLLRFDLDGDRVIIGRPGGDGSSWPLMMTRQTHDAYFPDQPFSSDGNDIQGDELGRIDADSVPLAEFRAMALGLFAGQPAPTATVPPAPVPTEVLSGGTSRISPPDTGDAGLN